MLKEIIVAVDGSPTSFTAFDVAMSLARRIGVGIRLVEVAFAPRDVQFRTPQLARELADRLDGTVDVEVTIEMPLTLSSVAAAIQSVHERNPDSLIVIASHGRGRSAGIVGSVTADLLRRITDPVMVVGPKIEVDDFTGPVIAPIDGSNESAAALPVSIEWADALETTVWIVNVTNDSATVPDDVCDAGHLAHIANSLEQQAGRPVAFEQLYGRRPAAVVTETARRQNSSLIVASTHGRSGWSRATMGSVAAGMVRLSSCPVLLTRTQPNTACAS